MPILPPNRAHDDQDAGSSLGHLSPPDPLDAARAHAKSAIVDAAMLDAIDATRTYRATAARPAVRLSRRAAIRQLPSAAFWRAYDALYGRDAGRQSGYRRERLPDPANYYRKHLDRIRVRGEWADARCPFHEDAHASLSVSLSHGGYLCHACGASGGDVLDFHRRLAGMGFIDAAKALDAWEGA